MSLFTLLPPWPPDASTLAELRALPIEPGPWVGIRSRFVGSMRETPFELCAWIDVDRRVVRAVRGVPRDDEPQALPGLLIEAMRNPDLGATPARPSEIVCETDAESLMPLAEHLGSAFSQEVECFDAWDVVARDLEEATGCNLLIGYLERKNMDPALVARLFELAARCWNEGLWRSQAPDTVLRIHGLGKSPVYACVMPRGLVICGSDKALKKYFEGSRERALCHNRYLVLRMGRHHEAGARMFAEIHRVHWPVAAPDAIPILTLSDRHEGMLATSAEMERAVDVLEAVLASLECKVECELKVPSGATIRVSPPSAPKNPRGRAADVNDVLQIKVTLEGTGMWRSIMVPARATLIDLHVVLQEVMGWHFDHLFQFEIGRTTYGDGDEDSGADKVDLASLGLVPGERFRYLYDFGDYWLHELVVEKVLPAAGSTLPVPRVLAGAGACPPEDCGGADQYSWLLEARASTRSEEQAEARKWLPRDFKPDHFDLDAANLVLSRRWGGSGAGQDLA